MVTLQPIYSHLGGWFILVLPQIPPQIPPRHFRPGDSPCVCARCSAFIQSSMTFKAALRLMTLGLQRVLGATGASLLEFPQKYLENSRVDVLRWNFVLPPTIISGNIEQCLASLCPWFAFAVELILRWHLTTLPARYGNYSHLVQNKAIKPSV